MSNFSPARQRELQGLIDEFAQTYPPSEEGQRHLAYYDQLRADAQANFAEIQAAHKRGEDITDLVLTKLLPYQDHSGNRERGAWTHIAPTIQGDIKKWYENAGWTDPADWPDIAEAIFELVQTCVADPTQLEAACHRFTELPYSTGFQSGTLSPILNALRPDKFLLVNKKPVEVLNALTQSTYSTALSEYPTVNTQLWQLVTEMAPLFKHPNLQSLSPADRFDMSTHWLMAVKGHHLKSTPTVIQETQADYADSPPESYFNPRTFALMKLLDEDPTRKTYQKHKTDFVEHVKTPFKTLMGAVAEQLPSEMSRHLETQKYVFGRIQKNDFGKGGAWPFYWGAFYPAGGKRTEDTQLVFWLNYQGFQYGFTFGNYVTQDRTRFLKNHSRYQKQLWPHLERLFANEPLLCQAEDGPYFKVHTIALSDWWHSDFSQNHIRTVFQLNANEIFALSKTELAQRITRHFEKLFIFFLLATEDDPLPAIENHLAYLGETETLAPPPEPEPEPKAKVPKIQPEYPLSQLIAETGFEAATVNRWVRAIERKKQIIFYGPPGTGKTYVAQKLSQHLIGSTAGFSQLVQFHPAYAYEDFIQGIRPQTEDGQLYYEMRPGFFLEFCARARQTEAPCVLIVDEINRANLSQVFGELMYLLEYRQAQITLAGSDRPFEMPENVLLIGTMNTADRSIALVDFALRRRFAFLELTPNFDILRRYHRQHNPDFNPEPLIILLERVNHSISDPNFALGISYFLHQNLSQHLPSIWQMEIEPYLAEFFFDQPDKVAQFRWTAVQSELLP